MSDTSGPAFPAYTYDTTLEGQVVRATDYGITIRDYFAAKAMQGLICNAASTPSPVQNPPWAKQGFNNWAAQCSYAMADAMLAERSKPQ